MQLRHISKDKNYIISGADLVEIIEHVVKTTIENYKPETDNIGKDRLTSDEAADYLKVNKNTLCAFHSRYNMVYTKGRPNIYTLSEIKRVDKLRQVKR